MSAITTHTSRCSTCGYYGPYYCATAPRTVRVVRRTDIYRRRYLSVVTGDGARHTVTYH